MSVAQIKQEIRVLSGPELDEITAYLFHVRHLADPDYQQAVEDRLSDRKPANWLTLEQFEEQLQAR